MGRPGRLRTAINNAGGVRATGPCVEKYGPHWHNNDGTSHAINNAEDVETKND